MDKLIVIDGNSLMYRAFFALNNMTSAGGVPTNALHGFLSMLIPLIARRPDYMAVAFDVHGGTFRHNLYSKYKAGRKPTPDELVTQMTLIKDILRSMGIAVCECPGFEADDILGTLSLIAESNGIETMLVTGDRDALQLVSETTHVLMTKKGISETVEYDPKQLMQDYRVSPSQIIDLKALMGDASDNIPGVAGVGEKTAQKLLEKYGDVESVLSHAEDEKGALRQRLIDNADTARLSYELASIKRDIPMEITLFDCIFDVGMIKGALPLLEKLQLRAIAGRIKKELESMPIENENKTDMPASECVRIASDNLVKTVLDEASDKESIAIYVDENIYIALNGEKQYELAINATLYEPGLDRLEALNTLRPLFEDNTKKLLTFDAKSLMHLLKTYDIELKCKLFDAQIADYLLHAINPCKNLRSLCETISIPFDKASSLFVLEPIMMEELASLNMLELYNKVELPLISVLFDMECVGFCMNESILNDIGSDFAERLWRLSTRIYELAGEQFTILSPKQLGHILFEKLNLPPVKKTKTGYSTDASTLEQLMDKHEIVGLVSEYRFLTKLKSTYIDGMGALINKKTHRVHTSFNQAITATGRISSTEPNLQNIPVRTSEGREIRKAFIASEGNVLVGADYSQIELRVLAHISGDERMRNAFIDKLDIHRSTAAEVFSVPQDEVTSEQRSAAKAVNFGIVYGISDFGLARNLGISRKRAGEYIHMYLARYNGVANYMRESVALATQRGYAVTLLSRRRSMPELKSSNYTVRSSGERIAMNMPIQGTAADIIKLAMVRVAEEFKNNNLAAKLILQVHDELIIDCPINEVPEVSAILSNCMENAMQLSVPLVADIHVGYSWYDTK